MRFKNKTWFIILMLMMLPPIGLLFMWRHKPNWNGWVKGFVSFIVFLVFIGIFSNNSDSRASLLAITSLSTDNTSESIESPSMPTVNSVSQTTHKTGAPIQADIITPDILKVHFIDVGQADASLVLCDGESMLIDGGNAEDSDLIYSYLKKQGVDHLNYIVNTHPHEDHVGGLAGALNYATVEYAFAPTTSYDSKAFNSFVKYLNKQNRGIIVPEVGDSFSLGSASVQVLGPVRTSDDPNNNSIVLKVIHDEISFLFAGDAEREEEQDILDKGFKLDSTVLKVGHHGSESSTTYPFLREIMPTFAVISVGNNNSYGHPTDNTLSRLRDADAKVMRTDMQGDIIFVSDGKSVTYTVERNANANTLVAGFNLTTPTESKTKETIKETTKVTTSTTNSPSGTKYILNTNTKKFHYPDCKSVKQMSEKNKLETTQSKSEIIAQGYSPCGNCNP
ncbi:MAG: MBL fold metallo-hydrolase [Clostridiaceae bacterium]|nr:MBL fold metallo-hydrolase [Clostridiaceae bacterium]